MFKSPALINTITGIVIFLSIPLVYTTSRSGVENAAPLLLTWQYWLFILYYLSVYFLLAKWVLPKFYHNKKLFILIIIVAGILASAVVIKPYDRLIHYNDKGFKRPAAEFRNMPAPPRYGDTSRSKPGPNGFRPGGKFGPAFDIVSFSLVIMAFLLALSSESVKRWRLTEKRALQAEADKANAELTFLKAQINPHFLFNTLNNIYSLAVTKSEHTADAVMKLSNIMRYVTDEANETKVPLQDEIDCIANYISLQKLRLGENVQVDFTVTGDIANKKVPPLSLMTFIENAFKHGISNHEKCSVIIKIEASSNATRFFEQNKLFSKPRNTERTGIGIENTCKRLQALYPGEQHSLSIKEEENVYTVDLILYG